MKRSRFIAGAVALAAAATIAGFPAKGVGAQTLTFSSGFQVQNLSTTTADVSIAFYSLDGTTATASVDTTIPGNSQVTYATLPSAVAAGFNGSAVISSNQRVAAIANVVSPDLSLSFGGEAYVGVTEGSQSLNLPLLFKSSFGFTSFFNVQNVGQTATAVTVTYSGGGLSSAVTEGPVTIQPGAAHRFDQAANTSLPAGFNGSAIVTSTAADVAAVVSQVGPTTVLGYNGVPAGAQSPSFPLVNANNSGFITGIALQNPGDAATNVTVSYTPSSAGTACTETKSIPAKGTVFFAIDAFAKDNTGENCANGTTFVGSAAVTANSGPQPLVGIVNQLNTGTNKGGSYSAFDPNDGTAAVVFPLIQDRIAGFFTGVSIVNVGTVATPITCSFSNTNVTQTSPAAVPPGGSFTPVQVNAIANAYNGSGTCRATAANAKIVGIANQVRTSGTADTFFVYEGANN